jgi:hypothetical protein
MDESGTHGGSEKSPPSPFVTVGACLAQPKTWKTFTTRWNAAKKQDGIKVYHAVDCANQRKEFKGWTKPQSDAFAAKMLPIMAKYVGWNVCVGIEMAPFRKAISAHSHLKELFGEPYEACFQWAVQMILDKVEELNSRESLAFFHEDNDYEIEAHKAFNWVKRHRKKHASDMHLAFGPKAKYVPLQAADILAYEGNKRLRGIRDGREPRQAWTVISDGPHVNLWRFGSEAMPFLIDRLQLSYDQIKTFGKVF